LNHLSMFLRLLAKRKFNGHNLIPVEATFEVFIEIDVRMKVDELGLFFPKNREDITCFAVIHNILVLWFMMQEMLSALWPTSNFRHQVYSPRWYNSSKVDLAMSLLCGEL